MDKAPDIHSLWLSDGYPALVHFSSRDPDSETLICRRFQSLSARLLLKQQAELVLLEAKLSELENNALRSGDAEFSKATRSHQQMLALGGSHDGARLYLTHMQELEVALQTYHETVLRLSEVARIRKPTEHIVRACRRELHGPTLIANEMTKLVGREASYLDDEDDLIALSASIPGDLLSRFIRSKWPLMRTRGSRADHAWFIDDRAVVSIAGIINTLVAALLLVGSILTLYFVTDQSARLGILLGYIVLFTIGLKICTTANRDSVFAATAAYSAVLIVFVSGNLSSSNAPSTA